MGLEFRLVRTLNELENIYKLRYQIYLQVEYIKKEEYPDEKETDEFDEFSTHFYAYSLSENKAVGAIRLINDINKLPVDELYDISFLRKKDNKIVEVSRRVTLPGRIKANYGLLQIACQYSRANNITHFVFSSNPADFAFYFKLGCKKFGDLRYYSKVNMPAEGMYIRLDEFKHPYNINLFMPSKNIIL